jgi:hypothetical protein
MRVIGLKMKNASAGIKNVNPLKLNRVVHFIKIVIGQVNVVIYYPKRNDRVKENLNTVWRGTKLL